MLTYCQLNTQEEKFSEIQIIILWFFFSRKCHWKCHLKNICHFLDDVIKWKLFPCYWPFVWGIHQSAVNSLHKGQWRRALMFSLICTQIDEWVNNGEAGDLRWHRFLYDVIVMSVWYPKSPSYCCRLSLTDCNCTWCKSFSIYHWCDI